MRQFLTMLFLAIITKPTIAFISIENPRENIICPNLAGYARSVFIFYYKLEVGTNDGIGVLPYLEDHVLQELSEVLICKTREKVGSRHQLKASSISSLPSDTVYDRGKHDTFIFHCDCFLSL